MAFGIAGDPFNHQMWETSNTIHVTNFFVGHDATQLGNVTRWLGNVLTLGPIKVEDFIIVSCFTLWIQVAPKKIPWGPQIVP